MRRLSFHAEGNRSGNLLHIETDGCIVNVYVGLRNEQGKQVTRVAVLPDTYQGEEWDGVTGECTVLVVKR
jgi:hypothetical protein